MRSRKGFVDKNGREVKANEKGGFADLGSFSAAFSRYVKEANIKPASGEKKKPSIHSLRKHHKTNLEYAGVPTSWVNKIQGRAGDGSGQVYTRPNPQQLIEMYYRGYDELRIEGGAVTEDIEQMKDQIKTLDEQAEERLDLILAVDHQNREFQRLFAEVLAEKEMTPELEEKIGKVLMNYPDKLSRRPKSIKYY